MEREIADIPIVVSTWPPRCGLELALSAVLAKIPGRGRLVCGDMASVAQLCRLPLEVVYPRLEGLCVAGLVRTGFGAFYPDPLAAVFRTPAGDREAGVAITIEASPEGYTIRPPAGDAMLGPDDWQERDTIEGARQCARRMSRALFGGRLDVVEIASL